MKTHRIHETIDMGYAEQWQYVRVPEGPPYFYLCSEALNLGLKSGGLSKGSPHLLCGTSLISWVSEDDLDRV